MAEPVERCEPEHASHSKHERCECGEHDRSGPDPDSPLQEGGCIRRRTPPRPGSHGRRRADRRGCAIHKIDGRLMLEEEGLAPGALTEVAEESAKLGCGQFPVEKRIDLVFGLAACHVFTDADVMDWFCLSVRSGQVAGKCFCQGSPCLEEPGFHGTHGVACDLRDLGIGKLFILAKDEHFTVFGFQFVDEADDDV